MNDLLSWLKRRRIARVALAYAVIGVGMLEGADVLAEALRLPSWALSLVAYLVVLGFPLVLGLAWAFQPIPAQAGATGAEERGSPPHRRGRVLLSVGATLAMGAVIGAYVLLGPDGDSSEPATDTDQPSIAVLPFANLSADPDNEYFSDGITEDLLTALTRISGVRVTSRTSSMAYKNSGKPLREIARELEVRYVLEGSVQRVDDDVRITAQLIDARDDSHLWAASYDRRLDRVFEIQSEITGRIADELRGHLSPDDRDRIAAARPADLRAYDLYLRGRQYTSRPGREITDDEAAIALFRQALAIDPEYAQAYAGLVRALVSNPGLAPGQRQDSALVLARRAVALDPRLPEARVALGDVLRRGGRLSEAAEQFQAALDEDPRHADALDGIAWTRALQGRLDEAIALTRRAARLDPLDGGLQNSLGWFHLRLGALDDAARHFQAHLDLVPDAPGSRGNLAVVNLLRGDTALADDGARTLVERAPERVHTARTLGHYYLIRGNAEQALRWLERHREMAPQNAQYPSLALAARMAGREPEARDYLARAEERVAALRADGLDPWFSEAEVSALRGDVARAVAILERELERGWRDHWLVSHGTDAVLAGVLHPLLSDAPEARLLLRRMRAELDAVREEMTSP